MYELCCNLQMLISMIQTNTRVYRTFYSLEIIVCVVDKVKTAKINEWKQTRIPFRVLTKHLCVCSMNRTPFHISKRQNIKKDLRGEREQETKRSPPVCAKSCPFEPKIPPLLVVFPFFLCPNSQTRHMLLFCQCAYYHNRLLSNSCISIALIYRLMCTNSIRCSLPCYFRPPNGQHTGLCGHPNYQSLCNSRLHAHFVKESCGW